MDVRADALGTVAWLGRGRALLFHSLRTSILGVTLARSSTSPIGLGGNLAPSENLLRKQAFTSLLYRGHRENLGEATWKDKPVTVCFDSKVLVSQDHESGAKNLSRSLLVRLVRAGKIKAY